LQEIVTNKDHFCHTSTIMAHTQKLCLKSLAVIVIFAN